MCGLRILRPGDGLHPRRPRALGPFVTAGSPGHLSTLGIQLRQGRMFTDQEVASGARVTVVTENMARGLWGAESAVGKCLLINDRESPCWEVVGVVESSRLTEPDGQHPVAVLPPPRGSHPPFGIRTRSLLDPGSGRPCRLFWFRSGGARTWTRPCGSPTSASSRTSSIPSYDPGNWGPPCSPSSGPGPPGRFGRALLGAGLQRGSADSGVGGPECHGSIPDSSPEDGAQARRWV